MKVLNKQGKQVTFQSGFRTLWVLRSRETFRVCKAIFSSSESKNGDVYTLETCMEGASVHINNVWKNTLQSKRLRSCLRLSGRENMSGLSRNGPQKREARTSLCAWSQRHQMFVKTFLHPCALSDHVLFTSWNHRTGFSQYLLKFSG